MKNPPDFVMYVVMYRPIDKFLPYWEAESDVGGVYSSGYRSKAEANRRLKGIRQVWGKENAYVQQYGPYK